MALALARVMIFAKDMEVMVAFYRGVVGLPRIEGPDDSDDFVSFDAGGAQLALHAVPPAVADAIEIESPPRVRRETPIKLAFRTTDVAAAREALVRRGAAMGPAREFGDLQLCDGIDPEGNVFQLSNRP